jgi:hypothetical protein
VFVSADENRWLVPEEGDVFPPERSVQRNPGFADGPNVLSDVDVRKYEGKGEVRVRRST